MAHDKAYTFVAALLRRSKNRTATNLDHYAKRSSIAIVLASASGRIRCPEPVHVRIRTRPSGPGRDVA